MASSIEVPYFCPTTFDITYLEAHQNPSPFSSSTVSDNTLLGDRSREPSPRPAKKLKSTDHSNKLSDTSKAPSGKQLMAVPDADGVAVVDAASAVRPKRVRTGCLTCRERHLKCDEGLPHCQNCRKSSRVCKRGVRLNFIDTQVQDPPIIPPTQDWSVNFQDESREIASEYRGGLGRYAVVGPEELGDVKDETQYDPPTTQYDPPTHMVGAPTMSHQQLPPIQALPPGGVEAYPETSQGMPELNRETHHQPHHHHTQSNTDSTYSTMPPPPQSSYSNSHSDQITPPPNETRDLLTTQEEVLFMQVFVEEVGLWMDSMDPHKHVRTESHSLLNMKLIWVVLSTTAFSFAW